jgi:uncharacterized membrane protein
MLFYFSIGLAIITTALYHIVQKLTPTNVNPAVSLMVTYLTAATLSLALVFIYPLKKSLTDSLGQLTWASAGLGVVLVGLELAFLLVYRSGWNISLAGIVANAAMALLLLPVGLLFFKEHLTPINLLGIVVCIAGLFMLNHK